MLTRFEGRSVSVLFSELIIVFVGVLLAFGAENWREQRSLRADARESLRLMLRDLAADSAGFELLAGSLTWKTAQVAWIVENRDRVDVPSDTVANVLWAFNSQERIEPQRAAWDGIENANGVAWIEPDTLRFALSRYYQATHGEYEYWQEFSDQLAYTLIEEGIWKHVELMPGAEPGRMWPTVENRQPLASSWREFQADRVLQNQIINYGRVVDFMSGYLRGAGEEATELMRAIRAELGEADS